LTAIDCLLPKGEARMPKKSKVPEPKIIRPDDIDPHHDWKRPLQAPGHTQVDFEERVNFRRLHDYRLARTRRRWRTPASAPCCASTSTTSATPRAP
jgi:hypothetical protein